MPLLGFHPGPSSKEGWEHSCAFGFPGGKKPAFLPNRKVATPQTRYGVRCSLAQHGLPPPPSTCRVTKLLGPRVPPPPHHPREHHPFLPGSASRTHTCLSLGPCLRGLFRQQACAECLWVKAEVGFGAALRNQQSGREGRQAPRDTGRTVVLKT